MFFCHTSKKFFHRVFETLVERKLSQASKKIESRQRWLSKQKCICKQFLKNDPSENFNSISLWSHRPSQAPYRPSQPDRNPPTHTPTDTTHTLATHLLTLSSFVKKHLLHAHLLPTLATHPLAIHTLVKRTLGTHNHPWSTYTLVTRTHAHPCYAHSCYPHFHDLECF